MKTLFGLSRRAALVILVASGTALAQSGQPSAKAAVKPSETPGHSRVVNPFTTVQLFIEFNFTAGDAGIQVFFDGEAWRQVTIFGPNRRTIFVVQANGSLKQLGLTELRSESEEPSLEEILARFPQGAYKFRGKTVEGGVLEGTATLSHVIPQEATITQPSVDGEVVDPNTAVIMWSHPGTGIAGFQVIVERADGAAAMVVDVAASTRGLAVPREFLQADTEYKSEVLAISPNGNRTITERTFCTTSPCTP